MSRMQIPRIQGRFRPPCWLGKILAGQGVPEHAHMSALMHVSVNNGQAKHEGASQAVAIAYNGGCAHLIHHHA